MVAYLTYCKNFVFWDTINEGMPMRAPKGQCKRHAPTPVSEEQMTSAGTIWPATPDEDLCAEGRYAVGPDLADIK